MANANALLLIEKTFIICNFFMFTYLYNFYSDSVLSFTGGNMNYKKK